MTFPFGRPKGPLPNGEPERVVAEALESDLDRGYPPDPEAVARVRPVIMAAYRDGAVSRKAATAGGGRRLHLFRRSVSLVMAGAVLIGATASVAAFSGPGELFYPVRLAVDSLSIPFLAGNTTALDRMEHRLAEARTSANNPAAVSAALQAYREELRRALAGAGTPAERAAILSTLDAHRLVLEELSQNVPPAADPGLQQAIDQVGEAQGDLHGRPTPPEPSATDPGGKGPPATPDRGDPPGATHGPPGR